MKKPGKYLKFYIRCCANNYTMPIDGLCASLKSNKLKKLFAPYYDQQNYNWSGHWASEEPVNNYFEKEFSFNHRLFLNGTRQNIVLLMAAMAGEL